MQTRLKTITALLLLATSAPVLAAPAAPEGAEKLKGVLEAYFGGEPGIVTVAPNGDSYDLKLDFNPYFAKAKPAEFTASLTPLVMKLTELGGGKWQVDQDQSLEFAFRAANTADISGKLARYKNTGIFDEALGYFESSSGDASGLTYSQAITPPGEGMQKVTYSAESMHFESQMSSSGPDAASGTTRYSVANFTETLSFPGNPAANTPAFATSISASSMSQDANVTGLRIKPLLALTSFLVAHAERDLVIKDQGQLKELLRAALPLWEKAAGKMQADAIKATSPAGDFAAGKATVDVAMNGIVSDGYVRERFSFEGLSVPEAIVPPWARDLVPQGFAIDVNVSGVDLAAPAKLILDNLDLAKDPPLPKGLEDRLMAAMLPNGIVKIGLGPSSVTAKIASLGAEGSMTAGPMAMPQGQATVQLTGFDAMLAAIQAAPAEAGLAQSIPMLMMAKGMSKPGDNGALLWKIESTPQGTVTINGIDPMKM